MAKSITSSRTSQIPKKNMIIKDAPRVNFTVGAFFILSLNKEPFYALD